MSTQMVAKLKEVIKHYIDNPVDFAIEQLNATPTDWEIKLLDRVSERGMVEGVFSPEFLSWVSLWYFFTRPFPRVAVLESAEVPVWPTLLDVFRGSNIHFLASLSERHIRRINHEHEWFVTRLKDPLSENIQGFLGDHLLFVRSPGAGDDSLREGVEAQVSFGGDIKAVWSNFPF